MDAAAALTPIDIRDMTTDEAVEKVSAALQEMEGKKP